MQKFSITFFLILVFGVIQAQEVLTNLNANPVLQNSNLNYKSISVLDTIDLPFIDDFSGNSVFPDTQYWIDDFVFINSNYPILPPSIGVATFDAIDASGSHYTSNTTGSYVADYLTSKPINLDFSSTDSVYLSFYFQPGGYGNNPEISDSLILEFLSIVDTISKWNIVWYANGVFSDKFTQVMIPITAEEYLHNGFQFRFRNTVSYEGISSSGFGNIDMWNIDYVILNKNRSINDTVIHDVAFVSPPKSILKNYESIPWGDHYKAARIIERGSLKYAFRNNDNIVRNTSYAFYLYTDETGEFEKYDSTFLGQINLNPDSLLEKRFEIEDYFVKINFNKTARFKIEYRIETDEFDRHYNDTLFYIQEFLNYYALDDGSAENGYGLDAANASVACEFDAYIQDSLRGVYLYFNQTPDNSNIKHFFITIWDDNNGVPGNVLFEKSIKPQISGLNQFQYYSFDTAISVNDIYYLGWRQASSDILNIGFDKNNDNQDRLFYNINGNWQKSAYQGSLMIRPVFDEDIISNIYDYSNLSDNLLITPNPADNFINLVFNNGLAVKNNIRIYDVAGREVIQVQASQTINTSILQNGLYILVFEQNHQIFTKKIIIQHE